MNTVATPRARAATRRAAPAPIPTPNQAPRDTGSSPSVADGPQGLIAELELLLAKTRFAFCGVGADADPGSTPNSLLDMAVEHLRGLIASLESSGFWNGDTQADVLSKLCQFESPIFGAIGTIERQARADDCEDIREVVRLQYLDMLVEEAGDVHRSCDVGRWMPLFAE